VDRKDVDFAVPSSVNRNSLDTWLNINRGDSAMTPELNEEYSEPDEDKIFKEMADMTVSDMHRLRGHLLRGQHAKATGCVEAEFRIADSVPSDLRHGVFRESGRVFRAIVRFSNSKEKLEHDSKPAARGMAIKLLDVEGPRAMRGDDEKTQDFLMVNHPVFPFANPAEYLETMRRKAVPVIGGIWALLTLDPKEAEIRRDSWRTKSPAHWRSTTGAARHTGSAPPEQEVML